MARGMILSHETVSCPRQYASPVAQQDIQFGVDDASIGQQPCRVWCSICGMDPSRSQAYHEVVVTRTSLFAPQDRSYSFGIVICDKTQLVTR